MGGEGDAARETPSGRSAEKPSLSRELWDSKCWRLFPLLSIYVISLTLLMPIKPNLMTDFFASRHAAHYIRCEEYEPRMEPSVCRNAHSTVVTYSSWSDFFSQSFLLFLLAPMVGRWSDVYGRKPFLMLTFALASCTVLVLFLNLNFGVSMFFYFPAQAINGALSSISICMAYISDKMHPDNRAPAFGFIICSFSVGILVGPLGGGYIPPPIAAIAALSGVCFCVFYVLLFIPESVTAEKAEAAREKQRAAPIHLKGPFQGFHILLRSSLSIKLTLVVMLTGIVTEGMYELMMQYFQLKLNFDSKDQAHMYFLAGCCGMVTQLIILRLLLKYAGKSGMLLIGLSASLTQEILMILARNKSMALYAVCLGTIGNISFPAVSSIKSSIVAESEQGSMQGALSGARALAQGIGPLIFAGLFSLFTQSWSHLPYFPGAPFIFGATLILVAIIIAATIDRNQAEYGLKDQGYQDSLNSPLLDPELGEGHAPAKEEAGLPEGFVLPHCDDAMLLDIVPECACDIIMETERHWNENSSLGASNHGRHVDSHAVDVEVGGDLEIETDVGTPQDNDSILNPLDPRDSASSRHGEVWPKARKDIAGFAE